MSFSIEERKTVIEYVLSTVKPANNGTARRRSVCHWRKVACNTGTLITDDQDSRSS